MEQGTKSKKTIISHEQRQTYLKYLDDALNPSRGLFARIPEEEYLGIANKKGKTQAKTWQFRSTLPCLSFTENSLSECADHWQQYGRLAFGFTKQFIARNGGGPMSYCLGTKDCDRMQDLTAISRLLGDKKQAESAASRAAQTAFERIVHFYKRLRPIIEDRKPPTKAGGRAGKSKPAKFKRQPTTEEVLAKDASLPPLRAMEYLEEHEWRLAYHENHDKWHCTKGNGKPEEAWFHIVGGDELQVVIVPDNLTYKLVHEDHVFSDRLFKTPQRPIQVVSLEILARTH